PCSGSLWGASQRGEGAVLLEIDPASGQPTGREIETVGAAAGGLAVLPAPGGLRTWFAHVDRSGPDRLRVGVLHQVPGVCDGLEAWTQVDAGVAGRHFESVPPGASTLTVGTRGTPASAAAVWFVNLGPGAFACGDVTWIGPSFHGIGDFQV